MNERHAPQPEPSDEALAAQVVQGDVTAFAALYDRYASPIYSMATHMLGHTTDAEEMVQEVFIRLWNRADLFDAERGAFKPWFMAVARYRILDELRRRKRREQRVIAADDINQILATAKDPKVDVEKEVGLRADSQAILQALKSLPNEQRRVLILAYFGGFSQSSIAQQLGWPLGTVKKRIRLGMQKLRVALTSEILTAELQDGSTSSDAT